MPELSLTVMCSPYKEMGLTKEMVLQGLIDGGLMEDIRRITEKGIAAGIKYEQRQNSEKRYPVYPESIQEIVKNNAQWFLQTYQHLKKDSTAANTKTTLENGKQPTYDTTQNQENISTATSNFPHLGLTDFVVLDTETTGLNSDDEVVEVAVTDMDGNTLYSQRFFPTKEINPGAARVNHLSKRILQGNPQFSAEHWKQIKIAIGDKKVLGHNIPFDKRLLSQTLIRYGIEDDTASVFEGMYDSKVIAKQWMSAPSYSLNKLTTQIGITREEQHEAADDCRMTVEFLKRLEDIINIKRTYDFIKC